MKREILITRDRRHFLTLGMGGCALLCMAGSPVSAHKFDTKFPRPITYKQFYNLQYAEFIKFAKVMAAEIGEDKLLQILKKQTEKRMLQYGQYQAKRMADNSFKSYVSQFKDPKRYKFTLLKEVVEDTEQVFELKVTECIWASTFLKRKAGKIGFAVICYGDYFWPKGFNPKIKMVRSKTLMEGHDCCNHRYILKG